MLRPQFSTSAENQPQLTFACRKLWCESGFWCFLLVSCCFFNFLCLHPEVPWPSREWRLCWLMVDPKFVAKLLQAPKNCCTERHRSKICSISYKPLVILFLVWMETCVANSVPFLPVPEVSLGFTMRLFWIKSRGQVMQERSCWETSTSTKPLMFLITSKFMGGLSWGTCSASQPLHHTLWK